MKEFFQLESRGTNVRTEMIAGVTTFLTMAYIVVVNPAILSSAGVPFDQVFMATIIAAVVGTLIMALFANFPIAIAPGMGMNAYFVTVVLNQGISYQTVFATVFLAGVLFVLLTFTPLRRSLIAAIPDTLKVGITVGIGLFIAFLGLRMSGIIVQNPETFVSFGDITEPVTLLSIIGLFITLILVARNVKGALFFGMLITAVIGYFASMLEITGVVSLPSMPVFWDLDIMGVFEQSLYTVIFAFLLVTIFDTTGTTIGVAEQAGLMKDGKLKNANAALQADAISTTVGATFGTTPTTAYIESTAGVQAGGRTGLTTLVVAILFIGTIFFTPIVETIAALPAITAPTLIIVGSFMMAGLERVKWKQFDEAFPAFIVIISMPLTSSIATGIALGFITYPLLKLFSGKGKEVHPLIYIFGIIFVLQLIFFPGH